MSFETLRRTLNPTVIVVMIVGLAVGAGISWWINQPVPPWLEIGPVRATYEPGSKVIKVTGDYTARKTCSRKEEGTPPDAPDPLIWRQEVQGTGPEVVEYAPRPEPPSLQIGTHVFEQEIPLEEGISPDGWTVAVISSCGSETVAVRSKSVVVEFIKA